MIQAKRDLLSALGQALSQVQAQVAPDAAALPASVSPAFEAPKQAAHGDFACTAAMQLAKPLKLNPRALGEQHIPRPDPHQHQSLARAQRVLRQQLHRSARRHTGQGAPDRQPARRTPGARPVQGFGQAPALTPYLAFFTYVSNHAIARARTSAACAGAVTQWPASG